MRPKRGYLFPALPIVLPGATLFFGRPPPFLPIDCPARMRVIHTHDVACNFC